MEGKKNIALFMGIIDNSYSDSIMEGALRGAKECDVNLIIFPVDLIDAVYVDEAFNSFKYQYNIFCSYMNNDSIEGVIVEYGTITSALDEKGKREFLKLTGDKPTILLAERAEGFASACMDNESGLVALMEHLVCDHKYTKIGYLSGQRNYYDAEIRLNAYKKVMNKYNLSCSEDWIEYGNYSEYVEDQIKRLLERHPDLEAIVCANDGMAIGTMNVLKKMGIVPGKDIAVTGFDNIVDGILEEPALTTVKADPRDLSYRAVIELCKSEFKIEEYTIATSMVKRESCGCNEYEINKDIISMTGMSADWRVIAKRQLIENASRSLLERELDNATREFIFVLDSEKERYKGLLQMMRRLGFGSCALFVYDEFIEHKRGDIWNNPEEVSLLAYYCDINSEEEFILSKGELKVPTRHIFDWGMVRDGKRRDLTVLPLFFGEIQIGFISVEADVKRILYAYDIAGQISNILYIIDMKKNLEDANQSKNHFLANMSHEIRTPINAIVGFNEMILRESTSGSIVEYANDVKNAADALLLLVNDSLDFSKIEAGKMELIMSEYRLIDLFKGAIGMMTEKAEKKGLALFLDYDRNLPAVLEGDYGRLQQILLNLLSNAIKYTEQGQVTLIVKGKIQDNEAFITFKVKDTGIGIKDEDLAKLFKRFERIEEKRNRNIEGTGLGINITSGLLKLMGSQLKVRSVYGLGSEFYFEIRQKIVDETPIGEASTQNRKSIESKSMHFVAPSAKILVVDDNMLNRKVIQSLLKTTDIIVEQADSGEACIELAKKNKYDLIFLDHMMPNMDGIETFEILVRDRIIDTRCTPVIVLTANAISGAKEGYIEKGFSDYLAKPVLPKTLFEIIIKYLNKDKIVFK